MLISARALMKRLLLLIDEISDGFQPSVVHRIATALQDQGANAGTAILVVEQNLGFASRIAGRWAVMKLGEIDDEDHGPRLRRSRRD